MHQVIKIRDDRGNFDISFPNDGADQFCDGLGQIMLGPVLSKISLYTSDGASEDGVEQRRITARVAMSTLALVDMVASLAQELASKKDLLLEQNGPVADKLNQLMTDFQKILPANIAPVEE